MSRDKRKFTKEFKEEAVRLASSGDRTSSEIAASLGIGQSLLSRWLKASSEEGAEAFRGHGKRTSIEQEMWDLKLKNKRLEQELEFLKKVSRYFAKDPK